MQESGDVLQMEKQSKKADEQRYLIKILQKDKKIKNDWVMYFYDKKKDKETEVCELKLLPSSMTNKFYIVANFFEDISNTVPNFAVWYFTMLKNYIDSGYNSEIIYEEVPNFIEFSRKYVQSKNVDFSSFVDYKKVSKTSIVFNEDDIMELVVTSTCLKMYNIFTREETLRVPDNIDKMIYSKFIEKCCEIGTTEKIFQMIKSKTYRSTNTDKYMWDVIRLNVVETPETYTLDVFNFLMNNLLSMLDINSNPVPFFVSVVSDSLRWMMVSVYKERIIYGETFGGSSDIYGTVFSKESLNIYCCNDVIESAAKAGVEILEREYDVSEDRFLDIRRDLDNLNRITPTMRYVILPIASRVLEIPYNYLLTAPPKHIMLIGILLHHCAKDIMDIQYPILTEFLVTHPQDGNSDVFRSSYTFKNLPPILSDNTNKIFGLNNSLEMTFSITSSICGILTACKKDLQSIVTGKKVSKINYSDLEHDVFQFFAKLYSNNLNTMLEKLKDRVDTYF